MINKNIHYNKKKLKIQNSAFFNIEKEIYYKNGNVSQRCLQSQDKKYAKVFCYYSNGNIKSKFYYKDEELHKDNGPAYIEYNMDGNITNKEFYLNGKKVDELAILVNKEEEATI